MDNSNYHLNLDMVDFESVSQMMDSATSVVTFLLDEGVVQSTIEIQINLCPPPSPRR